MKAIFILSVLVSIELYADFVCFHLERKGGFVDPQNTCLFQFDKLDIVAKEGNDGLFIDPYVVFCEKKDSRGSLIRSKWIFTTENPQYDKSLLTCKSVCDLTSDYRSFPGHIGDGRLDLKLELFEDASCRLDIMIGDKLKPGETYVYYKPDWGLCEYLNKPPSPIWPDKIDDLPLKQRRWIRVCRDEKFPIVNGLNGKEQRIQMAPSDFVFTALYLNEREGCLLFSVVQENYIKIQEGRFSWKIGPPQGDVKVYDVKKDVSYCYNDVKATIEINFLKQENRTLSVEYHRNTCLGKIEYNW